MEATRSEGHRPQAMRTGSVGDGMIGTAGASRRVDGFAAHGQDMVFVAVSSMQCGHVAALAHADDAGRM
jgi:hypothetical protein